MKEIENVTITKSKGFFTLSSEDDSSHVNCGVIAGFIDGTGYVSGKTIKNVQVENCELRCSRIYRALRVGGIAGSVVFHETEIADNKVTDSRIFADADDLSCGGGFGYLEYYSGTTSGCISKNNRFDLKAHPIHTKAVASSVGGVVGCSSKNSDIEKSVSSNNEIILSRSSRNETLFTDNGGYRMGGIAGISKGKIENSFSKNCEFTANATYSKDNFAGMYSTSCAYVGGIAGEITENGSIKYSYSENDKFYVKSSGDLNVGGLVGNLQNGTVAQSYAKGNYIETDGYVKGNKDFVARRVGGLVGLAKDSTISSCFAYNDDTFIEKSEGFKKNTDSKFAGLIAGVSSVSVINCATYNKNLQSVTTDEFIPFDVGSADSCYISATTYGNTNGCEIISEEFWFSPNLLQDKLNLMGTYWNLTTGELPRLKISD